MSCTRQYTKRYTARKSPPFPANLCCGMTIVGNDGAMYQSVANKNGVCRWKSMTRKPARKSRTKKDNLYHVTVKMKARSDLVHLSERALAEHLRNHFNMDDIYLLVDYNHPEYLLNARLDGIYLHFDVPKTVLRHFGWMKSKAALRRHILTPSLADTAWESGGSNFFLLLNDEGKYGRNLQEEIALISPAEVTIE